MPDAPAGAEPAQQDPLHIFTLPERPLSVVLGADAAERLLTEAVRGLGLVPRRGAEVGGILAGSVERGDRTVVRIESAVPVPCEYAFGPSYVLSGKDKHAYRQALEGLNAVGFYRTDTSGELRADERDSALFRELFPAEGAIALIITPRILEASEARCYVWENGTARPAGDARLRIPPRQPKRDSSLPRQTGVGPDTYEARESLLIAPEASAEPVGSDLPLPAFLSEPGPKPKLRLPLPRWYSWWIQAPLLIALLAADSFLGYFAAVRISGGVNSAAGRDPYALSLVVLQYGDNLHLSWDRESRPVALARRGLLSINDGGSTRTLDLTPAQLRNGSVTYRRLSDDVRLKLDVFVQDNVSVSESWVLQPPGSR